MRRSKSQIGTNVCRGLLIESSNDDPGPNWFCLKPAPFPSGLSMYCLFFELACSALDLSNFCGEQIRFRELIGKCSNADRQLKQNALIIFPIFVCLNKHHRIKLQLQWYVLTTLVTLQDDQRNKTHLELIQIDFRHPSQQFEGGRCQAETRGWNQWRRLSLYSGGGIWRQQWPVQHRDTS